MKKINVSEKCNACGTCTAITNLLVSDEKGFARPAGSGIVGENDMAAVQEAIDICPVGALSLKDSGNTTKQGKEGLIELQSVLKNRLQSIPKKKPGKEEYKFDAHNYSMSFGNYRMQSDWEYSSDSAALKAGLQEFNKGAYSQLKKIIIGFAVQYKNDKLKPYYTLDENGYYWKNNQQYRNVLDEIAAEAMALSNGKLNLSKDFTSFNVVTGDGKFGTGMKDATIYGLKHFEETNIVSQMEREFTSGSYHSLNDYAMYIDTDSMEVYVGTSRFGKVKTKEKYYFRNVFEAVKEFAKDVRDYVNYADVTEEAEALIDIALDDYFQAVDNEIDKKIAEFKKAIDAFRSN